MTEEQRQRTIRLKLSRLENRPAGAIPSGFQILDDLLGCGGLPRGRFVELFGPSSSGKTTLALQIASHAQKMGHEAAWVDADHSFDPASALQLSVNLDRLPVAQPASAEEGLEITRQLALSGAVDLIVVDSVAALVPRIELEIALGETGPGLQARVLASGLRKLSTALNRTGAALLLLNQTRGSGGDRENSAGGAAVKLYAGVRIFMEPSGREEVHLYTVKNKVASPFAEAALRWAPGVGFAKHP